MGCFSISSCFGRSSAVVEPVVDQVDSSVHTLPNDSEELWSRIAGIPAQGLNLPPASNHLSSEALSDSFHAKSKADEAGEYTYAIGGAEAGLIDPAELISPATILKTWEAAPASSGSGSESKSVSAPAALPSSAALTGSDAQVAEVIQAEATPSADS